MEIADRRSIFTTPAFVLGAVTLLVHLVFNSGYHAFSDELYFIVCGQHPALGYVDQPPLIPLIAGLSHAWFGMALMPLRLVPALAMATTVALAAELARTLGGGRFAQWLAGLTVLFGGDFMVDGYLLTTDCLQPITWLGASFCLVRLAQTKDERWWLGFGAIVGFSLLSKYLIAFYLVGLAFGILATPLRRSLLSPWLYAGAILALLIASPSIWWQAMHGWPFLELGKNGAANKNIALSPLAFIAQQILFVGPIGFLISLAGLWRLSARPSLPEMRAFPIAFVVMEVVFYILRGKTYYIVPFYPVLIIEGALALEDWFAWRAFRWAAIAIVAVLGIVMAPLTLPILPADRYIGYARALGIAPRAAVTEKEDRGGSLPLHLSGQFGWREMAIKVSAVYNALPPDERAKAVFYGRDYGETAALDLYGPAFNGPPAIGGHNNFYLWGPGNSDGSVVIVLAGDVTPLMANYRDIRIAGRIDTPFAESWETNIPIYVLRNPHVPLGTLWPKLKYYE